MVRGRIIRSLEEAEEVAILDAGGVSYAASLVTQGKFRFYTLTMPSEVLKETCTVDMRVENPIEGFQRRLDERRAMEIAAYIDTVFVQLEELRAILRIHGASSWLSQIRNDVQYRHQHGVWFPATLRKPAQDRLGRLVDLWKGDPMRISLHPKQDAPLGPFVCAAIFIVAFCHAMLTRIGERSSAGGHSFVHLGPLAYLKMRS